MSDQCVLDLFPDQIISEILIRLPAKSVCRFTCVSKRWLSLISSPHFIASYISHSTPSWAILDRAIRVAKGPKDFTLTLAGPPNVSSFSVSPHMMDEDLVNPSRQKYPSLISGSSGLLLFAVARKRDPYSPKEWKPNSFNHSTDQDSLLVCNPITRQFVQLPKPPKLLNRRSAVGFPTKGLGPGGVVPSFVVTECQPIIGSEYAYLMTFSPETGKWEVKSANYMFDMHFWKPWGVLEFDGHLVWFDLSCGLIVWNEPFTIDKVVQCRFTPLRQGCITRLNTPHLNEQRCMGVGGGSIQYLEMVDGEFLRMWRRAVSSGAQSIFEGYLADESYLANELPKVTPNVCVIHPFEADVAFFVVKGRIFSVNVGEKKVLSCGVYSGLIGSIQHSPTAVAYANRAAAYLKISGYRQAENDCTEALKLDVARKELGKLIEAKEDAELCLKLDPSLQKLQAEIDSLLKKGSSDLFPDHIVCEILTRLPAKSICRFKCVSKRWFSLISSARFITSYISNSTPSWAILDRAIRIEKGPNPEDGSLSFSLTDPPNVSSLSVSPHMVDEDLVDPSRRNFPALISASSGLLLFAVARKRDPYGGYGEKNRDPNSFSLRTDYDTLVLCNPITHQWSELPDPPRLLNHRCAIGLATRAAGPGGSAPNFVVTEYRPLIGTEKATLMTFSSESGKWENKSANYMLDMHLWRPGGVFEYHGHLVWTDMSCGLIVWDDPFSSQKKVRCGFIPLPQSSWKRFDTPDLEKERCVGVGGGCIQYLEMVEGEVLKLWRLKDYQGGEWGLVHNVSLMDVWRDESYLACGLPKVKPVVNLIHPFEEGPSLSWEIRFFQWILGRKSLMRFDFPFVIPTWPTSFPPLFRESLNLLRAFVVALSAKESGNEYFKAKNFNEAIHFYSNSIHHSPTAAAYANRAAAYLKIGGYPQAEDDCTEALKLDGQYMKAYARRATARKELGKLREANEDAEVCLKLDPRQDDMQKLLDEIKSLLEKVKNYIPADVIIMLLSYAIYVDFKCKILFDQVTWTKVIIAGDGEDGIVPDV
ncbi:hypothetical protein Cgig2_006913 [Carnegiea gigantea]|uniref:F-box domain-containing protein n=1 Tax=Carnegiea gigantea TaxID=171969 RepID=A0A9Q1K2Z1_9CARY|nr:hypothetical protein Cgig2_006913 [Carnegiea gigantea]